MKGATSRDRQLRTLELKDVMQRRRLDQALNVKQFAIAAGLSYSMARDWFRKPEFPAIGNYVFWSDFVEWRKSRTGPAVLKASSTAPPPPSGHTLSRAELLRNLPPRARRILEDI